MKIDNHCVDDQLRRTRRLKEKKTCLSCKWRRLVEKEETLSAREERVA